MTNPTDLTTLILRLQNSAYYLTQQLQKHTNTNPEHKPRPMSKLTQEQRIEARALRAQGLTLRTIADRYGVTTGAIHAITRDIPHPNNHQRICRCRFCASEISRTRANGSRSLDSTVCDLPQCRRQLRSLRAEIATHIRASK